MFENGASAHSVVSPVRTVTIRPVPPPDGPIQLSLQDLIFTSKTGFLTLFFGYPINSNILESRLRELACIHYELCSRLFRPAGRCHMLRMDGDIGFPLIVQGANLHSHDALHEHGRIQGQVDRFPATLELPLFVEEINTQAMLAGKEPLFKVKLTHYTDGACSLAFTICNVLADFPRLYNFVNDLAKLMKDETVVPDPVDNDRSRLWPDRFLPSLSLENNFPPACTPRKFPLNYDIFNYDSRQFPGEEVSLEILFFPDDMLQNVLEELNAVLLNDGKRILKQQLIAALLWLLRAELEALSGQNAKKLLDDGQCLLILDLMEHSRNIVPYNYFGNAYAIRVVPYKEIHDAFPDNIMKHLLLNACLAIHKVWEKLREPEYLAETLMMPYQVANNQNHFAPFSLNIRSGSWFNDTTENKNCDFGSGSPNFALTCPFFPFFHYSSASCPVVGHGGVFISLFVIDRHKSTFLDSKVLNECAPNTRFVFQQDNNEAMHLW